MKDFDLLFDALLKLHSSDDEAPMEEEDEVKEIQKERAKNLSIEDFGLEDASEDETNRELTLEVRLDFYLVTLTLKMVFA